MGVGKTSLILNFLLKPDLLDYKITILMIVYGKSVFQPKCKIIKCVFNNNLDKRYMRDLFKKWNEIITKAISPYTLNFDSRDGRKIRKRKSYSMRSNFLFKNITE